MKFHIAKEPAGKLPTSETYEWIKSYLSSISQITKPCLIPLGAPDLNGLFLEGNHVIFE